MKSSKQLHIEAIKRADAALNGGSGSGNWGHGGRPGVRGGSGKGIGSKGARGGIKRVVREDKYIKQVTHSLKVNGGRNTIESDMVYDKTNGKITLNASATGNIDVRDTMAYHSLTYKSTKEAIGTKGFDIVQPKGEITREVREDSYSKQVDFNARPDGMWTSSRVTKVKKDGLGEKAGDITINTSATGDLSIQQMQTHQYMVYQAIREANKI